MTEWTEQRLGYGFGLLGGGLIVLVGVVTLFFGAYDVVGGRGIAALGNFSAAVLEFAVGGLAVFFAWLGRHDWASRPLASGVLLLVMAVAGAVVLGLGASRFMLVGALFIFLAGVLYLLEPAKQLLRAAA